MFNIFKSFFDNKYQLSQNKCFLWNSKKLYLTKISNFKSIPSSLLIGINNQKKIILEVLSNNKDKVDQYKSGKVKLFGFFVGQVMKVSEGKANPQLVNEILKNKLK